MEYRFFSFKIYITGLIILFLIFLLSWLPKAQVDLFVSSEPLIVKFEVKLDTNANNVLLSLGTIPARIISSPSVFSEKWLGVTDEENEKIIIFQKKDLQEFISYKTKSLLDSSGEKKKVFEFHPEKWEIQLINEDISLGRADLLVALQEEVIKVYDLEKLRQEIKFVNIFSAEDRLIKMSAVRKVKITPWPEFYKWMPVFGERIKFSVHPVK